MNVRICWGKKVSTAFLLRLYGVCLRLGWDETRMSYLMACMAFESARTFSPSIRNAAGSGATGLIQFMPATARGLGTTTEDLSQMTAEDQLLFVEKYFQPYRKRVNSLSDMYMAILLPRYVGQSDDSILFLEGTTAYRQNSGLDSNMDGKVTKGEAAAKVLKLYTEGMSEKNALWV